MRIQWSPLKLLQGLYICADRLLDDVVMLTRAIGERIIRAYKEPSRQLPKLVLPDHPMPNPYVRAHKKLAWPKFLDHAWGKWGTWDGEKMAEKVEPLEKVTALHAVTMGKNVGGLYRLIAYHAKIDAKDIRGQTPAYWAAYFGNVKALTVLAIYGADLHGKDARGKTLLRTAAKKGHVGVIDFLASQRVDLNAVDGRGLTALHVAAFHGRFKAYESLLMYGADPSIRDRSGRTAEEILKMKYAEIYHRRIFLLRLFSSPNPPKFLMREHYMENIWARAVSALEQA